MPSLKSLPNQKMCWRLIITDYGTLFMLFLFIQYNIHILVVFAIAAAYLEAIKTTWDFVEDQ